MTAAHRIEDVEVKVSTFARAVALKRATVVGATGLALAFSVQHGWITPDVSASTANLVSDGIGLLTLLGAGAWIHQGTTPADSALQPRNSAGQDLVPDLAVADAVASEDEDAELAAAVTGLPPAPTSGAEIAAAIVAADTAAPDRPQPAAEVA